MLRCVRRWLTVLLLCFPVLAGAQALRVGVYDNAPKIFLNQKGQPAGIMVDLLGEIARREDWTIEYVSCEWEACLAMLADGRLDLLPDVAFTEERGRRFDFHRVPVMQSWSQVYRHRGAAIASVQDLRGKRIAVLDEAVQDKFLSDLSAEFGLRVRLVRVRTYSDAFKLAERGDVDAALVNKQFGDMHASAYGLRETNLVFLPTRLYFATRKGTHPEVLAAIDRYMQAWQREPNSVYFEVVERWRVPGTFPKVAPAYWGMLGAVLGVLTLALLTVVLLQRKVEVRTRDLVASERRLKDILDSVPSLIFIKDTNYRYTYVNKAACSTFGKRAQDILGKNNEELMRADVAARVREIDRRVLEQGETMVTEELSINRTSGGTITFLSTRIPLFLPDGSVYALCGISTDISARKQFERELRIAATVFQSQEGMFVAGPDKVILNANQSLAQMMGVDAQELIGRDMGGALVEANEGDQVGHMWESVAQNGRWQGELKLLRRNGEEFPAWLTVTVVPEQEGAGTHYVGTMADITEHKAAQGEIIRLANYDPLTQLPNRRLLMERLNHWQATSSRTRTTAALLFLDLDNFKDLNDTSGHAAGDQLLRQVAARITRCVREGDTVARLGGDEFVIFLEGVEGGEEDAATHASVVGWKIHDAVGEPYTIGDTVHHATCSIGVTLWVDHAARVDDLMKRGDLAMYEAKRAGRNTLRFFRADMEAAVRQRIQLEAEMREAVRRSQFVLHYQPQVDRNGATTGAEALLRWDHPQRGMIGPAGFIHVAETSGLILPIGRWVLRCACQQLAEWARSPDTAHLTLAVNVSASQFRQPDFCQEVLDIVRDSRAEPTRLKLELTESLLIENVDDTITKMMRLKELGVGFSLDDFGTGYSSLAYLKRLPLDQLKIDKSFVNDVLSNPNDASIARSIVALAKALGLGIIAEGVETERQRQFLEGIDCDAYQGYLFGRPASARDITTSLAATEGGS